MKRKLFCEDKNISNNSNYFRHRRCFYVVYGWRYTKNNLLDCRRYPYCDGDILKMSLADYRKLTKTKAGPSKYGNKRVKVDFICFDSQGEANLYSALKLWQHAGLILYFIRQPIFDLPGGVTYRADFLVATVAGNRVLDFKGMETKEFKIKKRQVEALYPVKIELVKAGHGGAFDWLPKIAIDVNYFRK